MSSTNPALADSDTEPRTVTVSASAQIEAEPDTASITVGVSTNASTARDALTRNSTDIAAIVEALKKMGFESRDIQTSGLNVHPRYTRPKDGSAAKVMGYTVSNQLTIRARDLSTLGDVLDSLVTLGANQIHGLSFHVSNEEELKDEARTKAIANAKRRAELFAAAAGAKVGKVLYISENTVHAGGPRPVLARRAMAAESVPIEAGSQSLEARVSVTWQLDD